MTVFPVVHTSLVEEARLPDGNRLTFSVPNTLGATPDDPFELLSSSLTVNKPGAPSYAHIRTEIRAGRVIDLNEEPALNDENDFFKKLTNGGYQAQNYSDFTGEGWIAVDCSALQAVTKIDTRKHAAYSLVCAPDFYPSCDQRELTEWTGGSSVPSFLRDQIWNIPPDTLCDVRLPPNLQLANGSAPLDREATITALVSLAGPTPQGSIVPSKAAVRHSHMPDDAAGVFAPGWDVSMDKDSNGITHLAGYALGSPFPEDTKLCAALSTFWPAVAPDATREMEPATGHQSGTVSPMTDQEIGIVGNLTWDGVPPPRVVQEGGQNFADYANFDRVDYVKNALAGQFSMNLTARVDSTEYQQRVLAMAFAYLALGAERTGNKRTPVPIGDLKGSSGPGERHFWKLLSFRSITHGDPELAQAEQDAQLTLMSNVYRCEFYRVDLAPDGTQIPPVVGASDFRRKRIAIKGGVFIFVSPLRKKVLMRGVTESTWRRGLVLV